MQTLLSQYAPNTHMNTSTLAIYGLVARTRDLGLGGSNIDRLAVGNTGHASINTVEGARGTPEDRDLGDAQLVVYIVSM